MQSLSLFLKCVIEMLLQNICYSELEINHSNTGSHVKTSLKLVFTALHVMQPRYGEEISVCLSVCLSVCPSVRPSHAWIVAKR